MNTLTTQRIPAPTRARIAAPHAERWALVTGASSGIGEHIAGQLAAHGYGTVLVARRRTLLERIADRLSAHAPSVALPLDLTRLDDIEPALREAVRTLAPMDVLVNCAGAGVYKPFLSHSDEDFDHYMTLNFHAARRVTHALLPAMLERRSGHIFHVCSLTGRVGAWGHAAYAASKGAMMAFAETLRMELAGTGVRSTIVYPGIIRTPYFSTPGMAPLWDKVAHRAIPPERVARAVARRIGGRGATLYVPAVNRAIEIIGAVSPTLASRLVRSGSAPTTEAQEKSARLA